jgi:hypothetical protein
MALTALLMSVPGDVLFRAKVLGLVCALGTLRAVWRLARQLKLPAVVCGAAPLLLGANPSFAFSAIDGMETSFQALLVTLAALCFVREQQTAEGWGSALLLLAAALNRAEGGIYFVAALIPFAFGIRSRSFQRRDALWLAAFLLPMTLFLLWRHAYYGDWLPNTVTVKSMPLDKVLDYSLGPAYLLRTCFRNLSQRVFALLISIVLWLMVVYGAATPAMRRSGALLIPLGVLAQSLVVLRSGGDWMDGWRYMMAAVPLWTLLMVTGVVEITGMTKSRFAGYLPRGVYVILVLLMMGAASEYRNIETTPMSWAAVGWTTSGRKLVFAQDHLRAALKMADILSTTLPAGATVAYSEMGVTPFYSLKLRWLDTAGLTDREVAHLATSHARTGVIYESYLTSGTEVGYHLLQRRPNYIIMLAWDDQPTNSVLNGAYLPLARYVLHEQQANKQQQKQGVVLMVWKRRPELDGSRR